MKKGFLGNLEKYDGKVELVEEELKTDLGSEKVIFVGSATDLFGEWVSESKIKRILDYCREFSSTYLFQSKNPSRFKNFLEFFPENTVIGTTLETNRKYDVSQAPQPSERYQKFRALDWSRKMISVEPIMDFDLEKFVSWIKSIDPEFVSIGADSKSNELVEPSTEKVEDLMNNLREFTEIRKKKNLERLLG